MSVGKHRVAAVSILAAGVVALIAWGRSQADETAEIRAVRDQFEGRWVAALVQAGGNRKVGGAASDCRIQFEGKSVSFRGMIGGIDARGTYLIAPKGVPGTIDLKLDAGWSIGVFAVAGDRLALTINALALPERLGVPTRGRPDGIRAGEGFHLYVFRRAEPGE
jgi:hypothetical protein